MIVFKALNLCRKLAFCMQNLYTRNDKPVGNEFAWSDFAINMQKLMLIFGRIAEKFEDSY